MEEFLPKTDETPASPLPTNPPTEPSPERLKMILVSSPRVVNSTIRTLYTLGFAEVTEWSPLQPTPNPNEVMSVLSRNVTIN
ncbi:MAG: hypothetical protein AB1589_42070 [Cyanobacteriota bacterium]